MPRHHLHSAMPPDHPCPFVAGAKIENPRQFVGRTEQLDFLTARLTSAQPTSINIIGDRRIGKSSLLYHFFQTCTERSGNARRCLAIYLSLQDAACHKRHGFYQAVIHQLRQRLSSLPADLPLDPLKAALQADTWDDTHFNQAIYAWKQASILPLLCLDECETWLGYPDEFSNSFYDNLRSLMDSNALMLVLVSRQSLGHYPRDKSLTSSFFNLGHTLPLGQFTEAEAHTLVHLPERFEPDAPYALSSRHRELARQWGGRHPYLLQLAAVTLWDCQRNGRGETWAKRTFQQQRQNFDHDRRRPDHWLPPLRWLALTLPSTLGDTLASRQLSAPWLKWLLGVALIIALLALIGGLIPFDQIMDWLKHLRDLIGGEK